MRHTKQMGVASAAAQMLSRQLGVDSPLAPAPDEDLHGMEGLLRIGRELRQQL